VHVSTPQWDLPLVLEALVTEPFEPLELSSLKALSWNTALLLALTSANRVSELTALSVHPSCLLIRGDQSGATLRPNPSFVPKSLRSAFRLRAIHLGGFSLPPHSGARESKLHLLCPVRALACYVELTAAYRRTEWASDPLPGRNTLTFFLRSAHWAHTGLESPPHYSPHTLCTGSVSECGGHGALALSPCSLGTRERWCTLSPYRAGDSLRLPMGGGGEPSALFSEHTFREVSVSECALSAAPQISPRTEVKEGSVQLLLTRKPVRGSGVERCGWTTARVYIERVYTSSL